MPKVAIGCACLVVIDLGRPNDVTSWNCARKSTTSAVTISILHGETAVDEFFIFIIFLSIHGGRELLIQSTRSEDETAFVRSKKKNNKSIRTPV